MPVKAVQKQQFQHIRGAHVSRRYRSDPNNGRRKQRQELLVDSVGYRALLGGSWVVISRAISPLSWVILIVTLLITPLITIHEPPSSLGKEMFNHRCT